MDNITPLVSQLRQRITTTARNIDGVEDAHVSSATNPNAILPAWLN